MSPWSLVFSICTLVGRGLCSKPLSFALGWPTQDVSNFAVSAVVVVVVVVVVVAVVVVAQVLWQLDSVFRGHLE